jgi:hypothetical protein
MMTRTPMVPVLLVLGWLLPGVVGAQAPAEPQKLNVEVEVVLVSREGNEVSPARLQKMKDTFSKQNLNFTSFKSLSQQSVVVSNQSPTDVKLPNGVTASIKLQSLQSGTATLRVDVPQQTAASVQLGREGAVYQRAGKHLGGELILVLSSPPGK